MEKIKVGINGFGRIGRNVFRIICERPNLEIVGVNDLTSTKVLAHLLKYDSTQGKFPGTVEYDETALIVNGVRIPVTAERSPLNIKWGKTPDVVVESTGVFRSKESSKGGYGDHLKNGAKKVILSAPSKDAIDATIVVGVNNNDLTDDIECVSNASCTTNCLAPVAKVLNDRFGIEQGYITTIHSYTNDQVILDGPHSDLRRHVADPDHHGCRQGRGYRHPRTEWQTRRHRRPRSYADRFTRRPRLHAEDRSHEGRDQCCHEGSRRRPDEGCARIH